MEISPADWVRLGDAIRNRRNRVGYADTKEWAAAVGRSTRVVLGLERGEITGGETVSRVEELLGWTQGVSQRILRREAPNGGNFEWWLDHLITGDLDKYARAVAGAEKARRQLPPRARSPRVALADATVPEILVELDERFRRVTAGGHGPIYEGVNRAERLPEKTDVADVGDQQRTGGDGSDSQADEVQKSVELTQADVAPAARNVGRKSKGQQIREAHDEGRPTD